MADMWLGQLSAAQRKLYEATLVSSHQAHTHVELWFRDRTLANALTGDHFAIDGQVDLDGTARSATCSVADTTGDLKLSTNLIFLDRILRVERHVVVPGLATVRVPQFTGPVIKADENGGIVALEAHGMELWLQGAQRRVRRWAKGAKVTDVITSLLRLGGVQPAQISVPTRGERLPKSFQVGPQYEGGIWAAVTYLAETINCDVAPDGGGNYILTHRPSPVAWEFTGKESVISQPQRSTLIGGTAGGDATSVINDEIVFGQALPKKPPKNPPDGYKPPKLPVIRGEAVAKAGSRFAPGSMGYPDDPDGLYLKEVVTLDHCRTNAAAKAIATERLKRRMTVAAQESFDAVSIPHLRSYNRVKVSAGGYSGIRYLSKASWGFNTNTMTVGYNALLHIPAPRHRK
jgi:hypothetical protein